MNNTSLRLFFLTLVLLLVACAGQTPRSAPVPGAGRSESISGVENGRNCERVAAKGSHIKTMRCQANGSNVSKSKIGMTCAGDPNFCARIKSKGG